MSDQYPIQKVRARMIALLEEAEVPSAQHDVDVLLCHALNLTRSSLTMNVVNGAFVSESDMQKVQVLIDRRTQCEPLQHITGIAPFRFLELEVGPGVFVPRPETQWMVGVALELLEDQLGSIAHPNVVDYCTGSAAIALSVATECPRSRVLAVEKSEQAAWWAHKNIQRIGGKNIQLLVQDAVEDIPEDIFDGTGIDLVLSNPPYIPSEAKPVMLEVELFDPPEALYSGHDGLDLIRLLSRKAIRQVNKGGYVLVEHGYQQGTEIRNIFERDGWHDPKTLFDLTGKERATLARY